MLDFRVWHPAQFCVGGVFFAFLYGIMTVRKMVRPRQGRNKYPQTFTESGKHDSAN